MRTAFFGLTVGLVACRGPSPLTEADVALTLSAIRASRSTPVRRVEASSPGAGAPPHIAFAPDLRPGVMRPIGNRLVTVDYDSIPSATPSTRTPRKIHVAFDGGVKTPMVVSVDAPVFAEVDLPTARLYTRGRFFVGQGAPCTDDGGALADAFAIRTPTWTDHSVDVAWMSGKLDAVACSVTLGEASTATAIAIVPGVAYAVRQAAATRRGGENLWIVMPAVEHLATAPPSAIAHMGPFTRVALPVAKGSSAGLIATFGLPTLEAWTAGHEPVGLPSANGSQISLTVEIAWPRSSPAPSVAVGLLHHDDRGRELADALVR